MPHTSIFSNPENWQKPVGKIVKKFEDLNSNMFDLLDEYEENSETNNIDKLMDIKNRISRQITAYDYFIDEHPNIINEITYNEKLHTEYGKNAIEDIRNSLQNKIMEIDEKIEKIHNNQNNGDEYDETGGKGRKKNKKTNKKRNKRKNKTNKRRNKGYR